MALDRYTELAALHPKRDIYRERDGRLKADAIRAFENHVIRDRTGRHLLRLPSVPMSAPQCGRPSDAFARAMRWIRLGGYFGSRFFGGHSNHEWLCVNSNRLSLHVNGVRLSRKRTRQLRDHLTWWLETTA